MAPAAHILRAAVAKANFMQEMANMQMPKAMNPYAMLDAMGCNPGGMMMLGNGGANFGMSSSSSSAGSMSSLSGMDFGPMSAAGSMMVFDKLEHRTSALLSTEK